MAEGKKEYRYIIFKIEVCTLNNFLNDFSIGEKWYFNEKLKGHPVLFTFFL